MVISFLRYTKIVFLFLIILWYILSIPSYKIYRILPIVQMGERSWPLYFFLIDSLALVATVFWIVILISRYNQKKRFSLWWILLGLLLIFPIKAVYSTYSDLTVKLCKEWDGQNCIQYVPPPDLRSIKFVWEKYGVNPFFRTP
jgi:hypothetical protein